MQTTESIFEILKGVKDPEIPVLTVVDMGVVRRVEWADDILEVDITPTYSGCPAMDVIQREVEQALEAEGISNHKVTLVLSPPWTTDWLTAEARKQLEEYGIAPPVDGTADKSTLFAKPVEVKCPLCKSEDTRLVSQFGSTACKAQYQCNSCKEPFDYFKCL